jgi:glycosyltransferase involved in cell wall biosynthesis
MNSSISTDSNHHPKISIGLPVYNGEKFLEEKIISLLNQTVADFEIIISDNASTDSTLEICQKYLQKDKRIRYFKQEKNMGFPWNFNFVLKEARGKYFLWTSVDDIILPEFIKKNVVVLESNDKIVCSASQVKSYGEKTNNFSKKDSKGFTEKIWQTIIRKSAYLQNYSTSGSYERKIRFYLKLRGHIQVFFGVYRTNQIQEFFVSELEDCMDLSTMINGFKFGDYNILDEVLMYRYDGGTTSRGIFHYAKQTNSNFLDIIFLHYPFFKWFWKNFGKKIFFKNIDCFIKQDLELGLYILVDIFRELKKRTIKN